MANVVKIVKGAVKAATKKKPSLKQAQKAKPLANPKSGVKVLPRKSAPKSDLSNRGTKPTKSERSQRAEDYWFDKAEKRWEGSYLTTLTGLKGPKGITSQSLRGQSDKSLRKTAAVRKEAKRVVKINSQQNLKKKGK